MRKLLCCGCKDRFDAETMIKLPAGNFHSINCATEYAQKRQEKQRITQANKVKKSRAEKKTAFRKSDITRQHKLTQAAFNKLRKLQEIKWFRDRGLEPECISCGKTNMDWCCGHFKTRGSQANLRYDEKNTYLQCNRYCNMALSGNINGNKATRGYLVGLVDRFGEAEAKAIIDYCESKTDVKKWTCDELIELRKYFTQEIKELEQ